MFRLFSLLALCALVLTGCPEEKSNTPNDHPALVRTINMVYDGGGMDTRVNNKIVNSGTTFGVSSGYQNADVGRFDVSVHYAGDASPRNSANHSFAENATYTMFITPPAASLAALFAADASGVQADKAKIRLVNCSGDELLEYELWITGKLTATLGPLKRVNASNYADLFAGIYTFSLRRKGDLTFSLDFAPVTLLGASAYTFVIHGTSNTADSWPFEVRMFSDFATGMDFVDLQPAPSSTSVSFVNAVYGTNGIDIAVDGTVPQIGNQLYGRETGYRTYGSGNHTYTAAITTGTQLIKDRAVSFAAMEKYSVFLTGTLTPPNIAPLELEDETTPATGSAQFRFIHLAADAPALTVSALISTDDKIPGLENISYRQVSKSTTSGKAFLNMAPGTYSFAFREKDSTKVLYTESNLTLDDGKIYTLWLGGTLKSGLKVYMIKHN